jgi:histidyl-tRNA synthetase
VININNRKFLNGFLESLDVKKLEEAISIIDKKEKIKKEKLTEMFKEIELTNAQIKEIFSFIEF